ncbi:glycoside hydrolase family 3 protein [Kineococcus sp. LSe6-4]|uniref:beta-glucosidase n=2 Tax=Kineococcus halophytocola TaxID=3234027 RepID=A0ABV4H5W5_9ACTN
MTLEEKAGLLFHSMVVPGPVQQAQPAFGLASTAHMVTGQHLSHFNLVGSIDDPAATARWQNEVQELARRTRLGIPVTFSTDPRNHFTDNAGVAAAAGGLSQWPEPLGLAALRSAELVERFADVARREYLALGLRVALHPQIDLATEPRWARIAGTFGEDADLTSELVRAYLRGFQTAQVGPGSVSTMTKHFPGGGPQRDGEDPHFPYGREQVYPGGRFDHHLAPFRAALDAGARQVMPYYGMPVGTEHEEVAFAFNHGVITGLLREELGFDGIVCTDWGLITDTQIMGQDMPARAWGVEHLDELSRVERVLAAGCDQFGGEARSELVVELVRTGRVSQERLDVSAARLLREKFLLGLFDDPFVDPEHARVTVGRADFRAQGEVAQREAVTLLTNDRGLLPLGRGLRVYTEGIDPAALDGRASVVGSPEEADVAVLRLEAPFEPRPGGFEAMFHAGSLAFAREELDRVLAVCRTVPTVVDVHLDRPSVLPEIAAAAGALLVTFGSSGPALLDVVFGAASPRGRLPFDLPSSMAAVEASRPDVPFDTADPLFRFGHGLSYD